MTGFPSLGPLSSLASMDALRSIRLVGDALIYGHTTVLPVDTVRAMLPPELELVEQSFTPAGTHPVTQCFQQMQRAHMTVPTLLPLLTYYEHITGIPYVAPRGRAAGGPNFYMPRLHLDSAVAVVGGVLFWGFTKRLARITVGERRWDVAALDGQPLASLEIEPAGELAPLERYPHFASLREVMSLPMLSLLPAAVGPFVVYSDFDKRWDTAVVRPVSSRLTVHDAYTRALPTGRFPTEGMAPGIDRDPLGSFELRARFRQTLVRPER